MGQKHEARERSWLKRHPSQRLLELWQSKAYTLIWLQLPVPVAQSPSNSKCKLDMAKHRREGGGKHPGLPRLGAQHAIRALPRSVTEKVCFKLNSAIDSLIPSHFRAVRASFNPFDLQIRRKQMVASPCPFPRTDVLNTPWPWTWPRKSAGKHRRSGNKDADDLCETGIATSLLLHDSFVTSITLHRQAPLYSRARHRCHQLKTIEPNSLSGTVGGGTKFHDG